LVDTFLSFIALHAFHPLPASCFDEMPAVSCSSVPLHVMGLFGLEHFDYEVSKEGSLCFYPVSGLSSFLEL
jgi:hypothetical protein